MHTIQYNMYIQKQYNMQYMQKDNNYTNYAYVYTHEILNIHIFSAVQHHEVLWKVAQHLHCAKPAQRFAYGNQRANPRNHNPQNGREGKQLTNKHNKQH